MELMKARDTIVNLRQKIENKHDQNENDDERNYPPKNKAHLEKTDIQMARPKQNVGIEMVNIKARKSKKVCTYFLQNRCKFDKNCYNFHPNFTQSPPTSTSNECTDNFSSKDSSPNTPHSRLEKSVIYEKTKTISEVQTPSQKEKNPEETKVCPFYLENKCKFQKNCKNSHPKFWQLNPEQKKLRLKHIPRLMSINPNFHLNEEHPSQP